MGEKVVLCSFLHAHHGTPLVLVPAGQAQDLRQKWMLPILREFARLSVGQDTLQVYHRLSEWLI